LPSLLRSGLIQAVSSVTVAIVCPSGTGQPIVDSVLFFWERVGGVQVSAGYDLVATISPGGWATFNVELTK
jgi:hypothetical protein